MNNSILQDLYYGKIFPLENIRMNDKEYLLIEEKISKAQELLNSKLTIEDQSILLELENLYVESSALFCYKNFTHGFNLGTKLMCEVFSSNDKQ